MSTQYNFDNNQAELNNTHNTQITSHDTRTNTDTHTLRNITSHNTHTTHL